LKLLGVDKLIVSNAAGGLNPTFEVGDLMLITDHIDLFPGNPLRGKEALDSGIRLSDMSDPFDSAWRNLAMARAKKLNINLKEGVYIGVKGPSLETKAEIRRLRFMGVDAVGMSTAPEVIAANQMGMRVLGFSVITNVCLPLVPKEFSHDEVVSVAKRAGGNLVNLVKEIIKDEKGN
jgi:purine-nucleoside phosphorylase